jgi:hypothetical protein
MKMRMMIAVSILALAICASPARATLLAYEGFDYSPGSYVDGLNGGTGFSTPWSGSGWHSGASAGSLTYVGDPNPVSGGHMNYTPIGGTQRQLSTSHAMTTGTVLYLSYLVRLDGDGWLALKLQNGPASAGDTPGRSMITGLDSRGSGGYIGGASAPTIYYDFGYTQGGTVYVVAKMVGDPDNNRWINSGSFYESPTAVPTTEPGAYMIEYGLAVGANASPVDSINIWGNGSWQVDEIRIGTTYADVVVPEPITLTLLGLGSVLMFLKRRR